MVGPPAPARSGPNPEFLAVYLRGVRGAAAPPDRQQPAQDGHYRPRTGPTSKTKQDDPLRKRIENRPNNFRPDCFQIRRLPARCHCCLCGPAAGLRLTARRRRCRATRRRRTRVPRRRCRRRQHAPARGLEAITAAGTSKWSLPSMPRNPPPPMPARLKPRPPVLAPRRLRPSTTSP